MRLTTGRVVSFLVAITIVKIALFLALFSAGRIAPFIGDNAVDHYIPAAQRLLTEGRFNGPDSRPDSKVPPGYSTILAATMAVGHGHYAVLAVLLQMIADLVTALLLFWAGRTFVGPWQGAMAGAVWLLYPPEVVLSTWITAETIFTTVFIAAVIVLIASLSKPRASLTLLAGTLLGAATLFRGTPVILCVPLVLLALSRHAYRWSVLLLVGFAVVVAPWGVRNRIVLDDPILVAVGFGSAFLQGSDARVFTIDGKHANFPELYESAARAGIVKPASDHEGRIDSWLFAVGLHRYAERLKTEPLSFVPFVARKALWLWLSTETGTFRGQLLLALCSLPIVLPGLVQVWRWAIAGTSFGMVIAIICAYFIVLHMATVPLNRYMLPIYPLLTLGASAWFVDLVRTRFGALDWQLSRPSEMPV
jgi:4-amino-4-deoxy-L-arabinose transferase-like glycosyltransferase